MEINIMGINNNNSNNNNDNSIIAATNKPYVDMQMFRELFPVLREGSKEGFDSNGLYWYRTYTDVMEPTIPRSSILALRPVAIGGALFPGDICLVLVRTNYGADRMLGRVYPTQDGISILADKSRGYASEVPADHIGGILKVVFAGQEIGS